MIMSLDPSARRARHAWDALLLARYAKKRRAELGLTIDEAAELSGMEPSQWAAIEAGWLPSEREDVRTIAATLEVRVPDLRMLIFYACCAQEGLQAAC